MNCYIKNIISIFANEIIYKTDKRGNNRRHKCRYSFFSR